ncbi:AC9 transposase [Solea senegalensis]|uniref:AC9 transposase n=1 Tax=Solea senegalensis TaxID=28829 RepID=A0AAV6PWU8_SOLSE|nr:AC9 transposase [Solea senegalensis]
MASAQEDKTNAEMKRRFCIYPQLSNLQQNERKVLSSTLTCICVHLFTDKWTACNKSYLGVTAHWINPKKITTTVTDKGSNFVKAFKMYQQVERDDEEDDEDEVTLTDISEAFSGDDDGDEDDTAITLPPHQRCASHALNLVSCTDIDKWLLSTPGIKAVYRSATTKCTGLWNKASRSTVTAETVHDVISKMFKTLQLKSGLHIQTDLPEAIVTAMKNKTCRGAGKRGCCPGCCDFAQVQTTLAADTGKEGQGQDKSTGRENGPRRPASRNICKRSQKIEDENEKREMRKCVNLEIGTIWGLVYKDTSENSLSLPLLQSAAPYRSFTSVERQLSCFGG